MAALQVKDANGATTYLLMAAGDGLAAATGYVSAVGGAAATGAAIAGNPVLCGGSDGTNAQPLKLDTSGRLMVIGGAASGATAAGNPVQNGAQFTAFGSLPAVTTGQAVALQADPAGTLKTGLAPLGTPIYAGSGNVANATAAATLTIPAAKMGYLDGFDIDGLGATAGNAVALTIAGVLGGTLTISFGIPAGATVPIQNGRFRFNPPLQASAVATNLVVTVPAAGSGNTAVSCTAYGHYV